MVDKLPASTVAGAGIYLPGNARPGAARARPGRAVRPYGEVVERQRFLDARGRPLCDVDLTELWAGVGECRGLPRADLHQVMLSGAGGEVRHETEVNGLEIVDGSAKVEFGDGSSAEYDLVVGADGRRSWCARSPRSAAPRARSARSCTAAWSPAAQGPRLDRGAGQAGRVRVMPMGAGRLFCYADERRRAAAPADPLARVREVFGGFGGPVPAVLEAVEKVQVALTDEVEIGAWSRGPVVLVGDAAHATSPTLAQGAAMALEDAVVLAAELRRAADLPEALGAYERRRRPRAAMGAGPHPRPRPAARRARRPLRDPLLRRRGGRSSRTTTGAWSGRSNRGACGLSLPAVSGAAWPEDYSALAGCLAIIAVEIKSRQRQLGGHA